MALDAELLKILACPACKSSLEHQAPQGRLVCQACKKYYPIKDGIPILLVAEAKPL